MVPTTPWLRTILFLPGPHHVHVIASWFPCSCKGEYEKDRTLALGGRIIGLNYSEARPVPGPPLLPDIPVGPYHKSNGGLPV